MARLLALCSLPRTNPKTRLQYVRRNGPYTLTMTASSAGVKLPFGTLPRLLLAWVCSEAVRTQRRDLVLGRSLYEFMHKLGLAPRNAAGETPWDLARDNEALKGSDSYWRLNNARFDQPVQESRRPRPARSPQRQAAAPPRAVEGP